MSVKSFIKKPGEMQKILGRFIRHIISNDSEDIDLKERAAYYYQALRNNIRELTSILQINVENEQDNVHFKEGLEFNTLSIIFKKLPNKFIKSYEYFMNLRNKEIEGEKSQQL